MKMKIGLWVVAAILAVPGGSSAQGEAVTVATGEWAPYVSRKLENGGFITEIISATFRKMNLEVEFVFYPWRRCYDAVVTGRVWAAFPYSVTGGRRTEVLFSDKISHSVTRFFFHSPKENPDPPGYETLADLKQYRVGGVLGYFYEEAFAKAGLSIDAVSSEAAALEKLRLGRIELLPLNELVGWFLIRNRFTERIDHFHTLDKAYSRDDLHLIASKSYPGSEELLARFNRALKRVKDDYIYRGILERYSGMENGPETQDPNAAGGEE